MFFFIFSHGVCNQIAQVWAEKVYTTCLSCSSSYSAAGSHCICIKSTCALMTGYGSLNAEATTVHVIQLDWK